MRKKLKASVIPKERELKNSVLEKTQDCIVIRQSALEEGALRKIIIHFSNEEHSKKQVSTNEL